ncbi:alpha-D-ribose 1-methylphosphonate 5-triphosphate diphosphatase [Sulfitobacter aestuariivivens]|uniref:Alpha-D-ribose 1-methylphosphonate 5-triphosphate diphosphatase n=1 Tax=Sulfitobacter aestuariivivens TaxID=2766981 RepID=A0A927HFE5_9RHOB|nr:alpha-D-ribose 1-methylphosphonate 5-triphosphate diphosphatase [Sulfitobacter aestuariivivens]MBD3664344.1 alpha-D-ribose 1-methylphosphonate 5-triphosphate diphosphatase [Sulfitobacter aestuariivivens]
MIDLDLTGAEILLPDGLAHGRLSFERGNIVDGPVGRAVDLTGYMVLPGIIDLHGDGFERHLAQRRGAMKQMDQGLVATEAELAANGITTAMLAQFVSWEGGMRGLEFAEQVFAAIEATAPTLVTDIRPQLRFETHLLALYEDLPGLIEKWRIPYIVFNDHLPHDRLAAGKPPRSLNGQALKARRSPEKHLAYVQSLHERRAEVPAALDALCARLPGEGLRKGSHDDTTAEGRAAWRTRGVQIAEFPETTEAAEAAHLAQDGVVLGAPNVVRGGSHKGNMSAVEAICMGYCDAIASDYHYPSPRRAALMLADTGVLDMTGAWGLISTGPARVLGLTDRGSLEIGKRADFVVLEAQSRRVAATFAGGAVSYMSGDIAGRFVG